MKRCFHHNAMRIGLAMIEPASLAYGPWVQWCPDCGAHRITHHYGGDEPWTLPKKAQAPEGAADTSRAK